MPKKSKTFRDINDGRIDFKYASKREEYYENTKLLKRIILDLSCPFTFLDTPEFTRAAEEVLIAEDTEGFVLPKMKSIAASDRTCVRDEMGISEG